MHFVHTLQIIVSYSFNLNNLKTFKIAQFDASSGDLIYNTDIDFRVEAINFIPSDNKIAMTGERDQLNVVSQLNHDMAELWSLQFNGNSAYGDVLGMGIDQYGFIYSL